MCVVAKPPHTSNIRCVPFRVFFFPPQVIVLETTGNYEYALPIISALLVTRFVANWFNEGIYDLHITLRKWPLLPDHLPKVRARHLRACDVMAKPPIVLQEIELVGNVFDVLRHTEHNVFPVVYSAEMMQAHPRLGSFAGACGCRRCALAASISSQPITAPAHQLRSRRCLLQA